MAWPPEWEPYFKEIEPGVWVSPHETRIWSKVERETSPPDKSPKRMWPYALLAIIVAALLFGLFARINNG